MYTWLTSMFLHSDPFHLGFNMFFLWLFGSFVEDALGPARYAGLYFAGGLAAGLSHAVVTALFMPQMVNVPAIGASGALAAVMGLFMVRFYQHKVRIAYFVMVLVFPRWGVWRTSSLVAIGLWFLGELLSGLMIVVGGSDGVARWAHIGGLLFGVGMGLALGAKYDADTEYLTDSATEWAQTGSHDIAAAKFNELAERTPDDPEVLLNQARSLFAARVPDPVLAAQSLRKAVEMLVIEKRPERIILAWEEMQNPAASASIDAKTLSTIASLAEGMDRPDMAASTFWRVVQEHPGAPQAERALFRLAHIYHQAGMPSDAQQCWDRFCSDYPNSEWHAYADPALAKPA